jgi:proteasome lid subunit RPN8/RPN11
MIGYEEHVVAATEDAAPAEPEDEQPRVGACVLSAKHLAQIEEHAKATYPDECCGVLIGTPGEKLVVASVHPATNRSVDGKRDRYEIDPEEILHLAHAGEEEEHEIVGFYHSHPDHPPAPSLTDVSRAWPAYVYLIIAVDGGERAETRAWVYDEDTKRFYEQPIVVEDNPPGASYDLASEVGD